MSRAPLAQLVERQSHNLKVASSILAGSNPFSFYPFILSPFLILAIYVDWCCTVLAAMTPASAFAVRCSLFTVRCSLFTVHCSLFAVRCSLFTVRCSLFTAHGQEYLLRLLVYMYMCV